MKRSLAAVYIAISIVSALSLTACSTTSTAPENPEASRATTQKAERIADRMGRSSNFRD